MGDRVPTLSGKEQVILELLGKSREMYGLELVTESAGALKRGTVYVTLGRMETKGYLASEQESLPSGAIGLPRRLYRPTPLGERMLRAWTLLVKEFAWEMRS